MKDHKQELSALGLKPNKALGQNFLCDEAAIEAIVSAAAEPGLPVIEIGPGLGALTLPQKGAKLAAVELDAELASILSEKLLPYPNARVINEDFLKTDIHALINDLGGGEAVYAGNLPYYITTPVCMKLLTAGAPAPRMVLMMQQEAADRFFACPGDKNYGPMTVLAQLMYNVTRILELSPAAYYPQPEVSSCVLLFESTGAELPEKLPRLLKCAFAMRRKTLLNNLTSAGIERRAAEDIISSCGLPASVRAEALTPLQFVSLAAAAQGSQRQG